MAAGRLFAVGGFSPETDSASAALVTIWRFGLVVQVKFPYALSWDSAWMSATVTGTGSTVVGERMVPPSAMAVTTSPTMAIIVAKASTIGREPGRRTGSRNPNRGRAGRAARTRSE